MEKIPDLTLTIVYVHTQQHPGLKAKLCVTFDRIIDETISDFVRNKHPP